VQGPEPPPPWCATGRPWVAFTVLLLMVHSLLLLLLLLLLHAQSHIASRELLESSLLLQGVRCS